MFGNIMTTPLILEAMKQTPSINISGFDRNRLHHGCYTPRNSLIYYDITPGTTPKTLDLGQEKDCQIDPNAYVLVTALERIDLPTGLRGVFVTASTAIQSGLLVVHGKLDPEYGGRPIIYGVKNLLDVPQRIYTNQELVHLQFVDQRGLRQEEAGLSTYKKALLALRETSTPAAHGSVLDSAVLEKLASLYNEYESISMTNPSDRQAATISQFLEELLDELDD